MDESERPFEAKFAGLRRQAEARLAQRSETLKELSHEQIEQLVHELQVHQIELEMQNEQLRRTQVELEVTRDQYADLYDFAPVGYITLDEQGLIMAANLTAAALLGAERANLIRRPLGHYIVPEDQDTFYLSRRRLFETGLPQTSEVRIRKQGDTYFYARLQAIRQKEGDASVCRVAVSDINENKQAEQYMLRTERLAAMGRLATMLSHEIKNPLQALRFSIDLLLCRSLDAAQQNQCLQICDREIDRLIELAKNVLDFARPERMTPTLATVDNVVGDTLALVDELVRKSRIQVIVDLPHNLPVIQTAPDQIVRILINLIINAIEIMPEGGWIHITSEVEQDFVRLNVANQGPLISAEDLKHIFDPFFTTKPEGTGLGLAISRDAIRRYGGDLSVKNLDDGQGVAVSLKVPVADSPAN
jgi:PAS domain S-box-containing protein